MDNLALLLNILTVSIGFCCRRGSRLIGRNMPTAQLYRMEGKVKHRQLKGRSQEEKRYYVGKVPKRRTPPTQPPSLGTPCFANTNYGLFVILGPKEHFWFSKNNRNFW